MNTELLHCSIKSFQYSYLPFIPTEPDISKCLQTLVDTGLLNKDENGALHWRNFSKFPSNEEPTEPDFFALKSIADEIAKFTFSGGGTPGRNTRPHVQYRDCPNQKVFSEVKGASFKIDRCFELSGASEYFSSSTKLMAPDIAVITEFKKSQKESVTVSDCHLSFFMVFIYSLRIPSRWSRQRVIS